MKDNRWANRPEAVAKRPTRRTTILRIASGVMVIAILAGLSMMFSSGAGDSRDGAEVDAPMCEPGPGCLDYGR